MKRHLVPFGVALVIAVLPGAALSAAQQSTDLLDDREQGVEAVLALGDELPTAGARNDMDPEELRSLLLTDATAGVDRSGRLYYAEPLPSPVADIADAPAQPQSQAQASAVDVFALESLPGAQRVIFIDFDGHDLTGTEWTDRFTGTLSAFDRDGDPSTFDAEREIIADIWKHVAEDYAPFAVNVTTKDPGVDAIRRTNRDDQVYGTRAVVTHSPAASAAICNNVCGGAAYVGVFNIFSSTNPTFHDRYQPALVFSNQFPDSGSVLAKRLAEAVSNEVGHNLDLGHAGVLNVTQYYPGHGAWAPIMGLGDYRPITQWSKGEYPGARTYAPRTTFGPEHEIAIMLESGLSLRADDHGGTIDSATELVTMAGSPALQATGVIERREDLDVFRFSQPCTG